MKHEPRHSHQDFPQTTYITHISTFDSGGNCPIDFVHLPDGRLIGITEDSAVLYASMEDFEDWNATDRPFIWL